MTAAVVAILCLAQGGRPEGGKPQVEVKQFPHAAACPKACKTCQGAMAKALEYLAKQTNAGGLEAGNGGGTVITAIALLPTAPMVPAHGRWIRRGRAPLERGRGG